MRARSASLCKVLSALLLLCSLASAQTLYTFPDATFAPVYALINSATRSLDMTMYELVDTTARADLIALAKRGVRVRVILDQNLERASNTPAFTFLNANGVEAVWANHAYAATHQKTITIDGKRSLILSANLTSRYYASGRDFALLDTDVKDVAEIERVFSLDFDAASATPSSADTLLWSPNLARAGLLRIIQGATHSLIVENEEMADPVILSALVDRARAGVAVAVIMTNQRNTYASAFNSLTAAGVKVYTYAYSAPIYIHAKVILADTGSSARKAYLGSINFSTASETLNRELGTLLSTPAVLNAMNRTLTSDMHGATPWVRSSRPASPAHHVRQRPTAVAGVRDPS